jgi:hypothetical protein
MVNRNAFGVGAVAMAPMAVPTHVAFATHAARAAAAIAPQRKRRTATATGASVDRGSS